MREAQELNQIIQILIIIITQIICEFDKFLATQESLLIYCKETFLI
jgi:hypothetical protein